MLWYACVCIISLTFVGAHKTSSSVWAVVLFGLPSYNSSSPGECMLVVILDAVSAIP